ncbi:MAG: aminopeptidase [Ignavibacteriales bacterium]|nr:aminopeptidase [Ignavibacteriales bacterium]
MKKFLFVIFFIFSLHFGQDRHEFKNLNILKTTPVKSQGNSGTCWVFATTSFVETELLRKGFEETDLSEMFTVNHKLLSMAENYVRYHGKANFGEGGQAHDLLNVVRKFGMTPENIYSGKNIGLEKHNHSEMSSVLQGMLDGIIKDDNAKLTPRWKEAIASVIDIYLGKIPETFVYKGKEYTPKAFQELTKFNPDDYVEITSYTDKPFYKKFILPLPDNWANAEHYNIPLDELIEIIEKSIKNGYSVCWDGDSGRDNFYREECYAVIPDENIKTDSNLPEVEKNITQEIRQAAFENFDVTDDHLMHIVGTAEDQNGTRFYYTKNSWGTENKKFNGYWYMSENYVKLKTVAIIVNKDSIPKNIKEKMGI